MTDANHNLLSALIEGGSDDRLREMKAAYENQIRMEGISEYHKAEDAEIIEIINSYMVTDFDARIKELAEEKEEDGYHKIKIEGEYLHFDVEAEINLTTTRCKGDYLTPDSVKTEVEILEKTITFLKE